MAAHLLLIAPSVGSAHKMRGSDVGLVGHQPALTVWVDIGVIDSGFICTRRHRRSSGFSSQDNRMRILVAEDEPINQKIISALLQKLGCEVTVAANGKQAVDSFVGQDFDIIFMDIQMPEVDGFEATRLIREVEQRTGKRVAIVACTAHAMSGYRELCLAAGMDGYMTKPISRQKLMETVESYSVEESRC
jgi:CheY-like chemotaxis protein